MIPWLVQRFCHSLLVIIGVVSLVFLLLHLVPGDPVDAILGEDALPSTRLSLQKDLGLDLPLQQQFVRSWKELLRGSLGQSLYQKEPVAQLLLKRIPATLALAVLALTAAFALAIPFALLTAFHNNRILNFLGGGFSCLGMSMPSFCLGPLLVLVFSVRLGWLPVSEMSGAASFVLPVATLAILMAAFLFQITKSHAQEIQTQAYIQTAFAKGLPSRIVLWRHILKNAMIPLVTVLGLQLGALVNGVIITETLFDWPGVGELLFRGIQSRDYPLVQGCVLFIAVAYVTINTLTDISYRYLNPKVRVA